MSALHPHPPHRDFRIGLILFGSLAIIMGTFCLLAIPLMLLSTMIKASGQPAVSMQLIWLALIFYLLIGVANIWLGVGSILCRRWARTLLQLAGLFWLFGGILGSLSFLVFSSELQSNLSQAEAQLSAGVQSTILIATYCMLAVIYLIIPGAFTWFYSLRNTRMTCEDRDSQLHWTDRCPTAILGLSLLNGLAAISLPLTLLYFPIFPFFGTYLRGPTAMAFILGAAVIFGFSAWGLYRLKPAFWWLSFGSTFFFGISYMVTIWQRGIMEIYQLMELPEDTLNLLENSSMLQGSTSVLFSLTYFIPYLGILLYCRKFLVADTPSKVSE